MQSLFSFKGFKDNQVPLFQRWKWGIWRMLCAFEKHLPGISTSGTGWFQDSALRSSPPRKGAQQKLPQHLPLRDLPFPCPQWLLPPPLSAVFSSPFLCLADFHFPGPSNKLHPAAAFELSPHFLPSAPCRPRTVTLPPPSRGSAAAYGASSLAWLPAPPHAHLSSTRKWELHTLRAAGRLLMVVAVSLPRPIRFDSWRLAPGAAPTWFNNNTDPAQERCPGSEAPLQPGRPAGPPQHADRWHGRGAASWSELAWGHMG